MVGKGKQTFKITLTKDYYRPDDVLVTTQGGAVHMIGDVVVRNGKWYHKILYLLTFKRYFVKYYVYNCEIRDKNGNVQEL